MNFVFLLTSKKAQQSFDDDIQQKNRPCQSYR